MTERAHKTEPTLLATPTEMSVLGFSTRKVKVISEGRYGHGFSTNGIGQIDQALNIYIAGSLFGPDIPPRFPHAVGKLPGIPPA